MGPGNHSTDPARRWGRKWLAATLLALSLLAVALPAGCDDRSDVLGLSTKAKTLWEAGQYADAARNFITLSEIYPGDPLAEESLFWAASLYQHFLADPEQAIRFYQHLLVQYPAATMALKRGRISRHSTRRTRPNATGPCKFINNCC